jgi:hypothetical protein
MHMNRLISSVALAAVVAAGSTLSLTSPASALEVYTLPSGTVGNQNWTGSLGLDFTVTSDITVTGLGAFYDPGDFSIEVVLYNATTEAPIVSASINATLAPYTFQAVAPIVLLPGNYQITAWGYGNGTGNYNTGNCGSSPNCPPLGSNTIPGLITGSPWYNDPGVTGFADDHLDNFNGGGGPQTPFHFYGAGNVEVAPLPATWTMLIAGFIGLGFFAYRGSKKNAVAISAA